MAIPMLVGVGIMVYLRRQSMIEANLGGSTSPTA
jgi:hypothetical protein